MKKEDALVLFLVLICIVYASYDVVRFVQGILK